MITFIEESRDDTMLKTHLFDHLDRDFEEGSQKTITMITKERNP